MSVVSCLQQLFFFQNYAAASLHLQIQQITLKIQQHYCTSFSSDFSRQQQIHKEQFDCMFQQPFVSLQHAFSQ
jgi:hypothetical protein